MIFFRRPRLCAAVGLSTYLVAAVSITDIGTARVAAQPAEACPIPLLAERGERPGRGPGSLTVLQGNTWMLPSRPLLLPELSTDPRERLERIVRTVRSCHPDVVLLQEMFEEASVQVLRLSLPDYRIVTSDQTDLTGTVNSSGLVTVSRFPLSRVEFHAFPALPWEAQTIEKLGRKGFLSAAVEAPGMEVTVVNLHLYAYRTPAEAPITRAQLARATGFVERERARGRRALMAGDFNMDPDDLRDALPSDWSLSTEGPTYDPLGNPYASMGSNELTGDAPSRHPRTIDYLISADDAVRVRSGVIRDRLMSDHYFLAHRVSSSARASSR